MNGIVASACVYEVIEEDVAVVITVASRKSAAAGNEVVTRAAVNFYVRGSAFECIVFVGSGDCCPICKVFNFSSRHRVPSASDIYLLVAGTVQSHSAGADHADNHIISARQSRVITRTCDRNCVVGIIAVDKIVAVAGSVSENVAVFSNRDRVIAGAAIYRDIETAAVDNAVVTA